jgi:hypothetical protein
MGIWDKVKQSLSAGVPEPLVLPDALVFNAIDGAAVSARVNLETRAASDGKKNHPSSDGESYSQTEAEIISVVTATVRPYLQNYDSQQLAYKNRLASLDPLGLAAKFRGQASLQINQIRTRIDQESGSFYLLSNALTDIENDWLAFKREWNIRVDPIISSKNHRGWVILGALVLVESLVNGFLIGPYTETGLLGGFLIAMMFPVITLLFCGIASGHLLRELISPVRKLSKNLIRGALSFLLFTALLVNLWLAYTREAAENVGEWGQGLNLLVSTLSGSFQPFGAVSVLLFLFSTGLYLFAVYDVFRMKHPIPGLIEKFKNRGEKHLEFSSRLQKSHRDLIELQQDSISIFKASFDTLNSWQIEYNQIQSSQIKLWQRLQNYLDHVEATVNNLLARYREINLHSRNDAAPRHFKTTWKFPELDYRVPVVTEGVEQYTNRLQIATGELEAIQKEVNGEFGAIPEILRGIDALLQSIKKS